MRNSATAYPTRRKSSYWYMPLVPLVCVCLMLIGVGLWVHYTLRMYYAAQQANEILNLAVSSLPANVSRIYASLVGTAVTYCIFAGIIMGLGVWKGWTDSDQDLQGRLYEHLDWMLYANMTMQAAWGLLMLWLVLMIAGDAVFTGWMYVARNALQGSIAAYNGAVAGGNVTLLPTYPRFVCPAVCFNANGLAFISSDSSKWDSNLCICDYGSMTAAESAISYGFAGLGGLFTGIFFMYTYGMLLSMWLSTEFQHMRTCQDFNERLLGVAK